MNRMNAVGRDGRKEEERGGVNGSNGGSGRMGTGSKKKDPEKLKLGEGGGEEEAAGRRQGAENPIPKKRETTLKG